MTPASGWGIYLYDSMTGSYVLADVVLNEVDVTGGSGGIHVSQANNAGSVDVSITDCEVTGTAGNGIQLASARGTVTVSGNTVSGVTGSGNYGLYLTGAATVPALTVTGNTLESNANGVYLQSFSGSDVSSNTIRNNTGYGIYLSSCTDNLIYNNYLANHGINAWDNGSNTWNEAKTAGTNIIGGEYLGGNYWSDYAGEDTDDDGLGDTELPYNCGNQIATGGDNLPLVLPTYEVSFVVTPASAGEIEFDGVPYGNGDSVTVPAGDYAISAEPGAGSSFGLWSASGLLAVDDDESAATTVTVSGEGTLTLELLTCPSVTTDAATEPGQVSVRLNGTLDSLGSASTVDVCFEWGTTSDVYPFQTAPETLDAPGAFSALLVTLEPDKTYFFRAVATGDGTSYGEEMSLSTSEEQPAPDLVPEIVGVEWTDPWAHSYKLWWAITNRGATSSLACKALLVMDGAVEPLGPEPESSGYLEVFGAVGVRGSAATVTDLIDVPALQPGQSYAGTYGPAEMDGDVLELTLYVDAYNDNPMESNKENNERVRAVEPPAEGTVEFTLLPGWNLVSVPLFLEDMSRAAVFPGATAVYTWDAEEGRYDVLGADDEVEPWRAYWVAANAETPVSHTGLALTEYVRDLAQGWHMLGSIGGGSPTIAALTSAPPGGVSGSAYTWNPGSGYGEASTLEEGVGYWVEMAAACRLDVSESTP